MKTKFSVTGMTCSACSAHVEKAVAKVDGVTSVNVSLLTNSMVCEYTCDAKNIVDAVVKAGYNATVDGIQKQSQRETKKQPTGITLGRVISSIVLCVVLMYVAMGHMVDLPLPSFLDGPQNATNFASIQLLLCLPVWYINRSYFIVGFKRLFSCAPNMDSLIAVGSSAGAIYGVVIMFMVGSALGKGDMATVEQYHHQLYFESSAMILALVNLGKYFEGRSKLKTGDALAKLKNLAPKSAIVLVDGMEVTVDSQNVKVGDVVVVKAGMTFPCDGKIIFGSCFVDQSALTGEPIPVEKQLGDNVVGGAINAGGFVQVQVTSVGEESTLSKIIALVESASTSKAPIQKLADQVSAVFVPVVMAISLVTLIVWLATGNTLFNSLDFAISVLVISCPCALGLATPVALMVATGKGAQNGILIKNGEILQKLSTVQTVVLDKTGTVTVGKPTVADVVTTATESDFLHIVAGIEKQSEHPLGKAVVDYAQSKNISLATPTNFETIPGQGVTAVVGNTTYAIGNKRLMDKLGVVVDVDFDKYKGKTLLLVAKNKVFWGLITVGDQIKPTSEFAIEQLKALGIKTVLLTGDNAYTAQQVCEQLGIESYFADVLPNQKAQIVSQLKQNSICAMVGDGINDAPALATADVGFAVADGTDIAIDSADVILVQNDLQSVATAIRLSKATVKNIKQNLFWAFFYNALGIPLAAGVLYPAFGIKLVPMFGALAMACSSLFVVTNALRLNFFKSKHKLVENQLAPKEITMTYKLSIQGMMCPHCTGRVESTLKALSGVTDVVVSLEGKYAQVTTSCEMADTLKSAVEAQGYPVLEIVKL